MFFSVVVCRLKHGQKITSCKFLYLNNRLRGQSSSKKSRLKRVHLLFDEEGNAEDANNEGSSVTQRVKSFLQAVKTATTDLRTSNDEPEFSDKAVENCLEAFCSGDNQTLCDIDDDVSNCVVATSAEQCLSSLTADVMDTYWYSTCENDTAADDCDEVNKETEADEVCDSDPVDSTSSSVVASNDPEISKYWWQRYRLFSRFDRGIMIDRGW